MKTLTFSIVSLALLGLLVGPVAASPLIPQLVADLDGDGELETVRQYRGPVQAELFRMADLDGDGDPDLVETRGVPVLLCHLDADPMSEAVIQDPDLSTPWAAGAIASATNPITNWGLVFVRGQVVACVSITDSLSEHQVLYVSDPAYSGTADIDGDGVVDIVWQSLPAIIPAPGPARW